MPTRRQRYRIMMWESKNPPCRVEHHVGLKPQAYDIVLRVTGYTLGTVTRRSMTCLVPGAEDVVSQVRSRLFT
jgi:hypothetical protein